MPWSSERLRSLVTDGPPTDLSVIVVVSVLTALFVTVPRLNETPVRLVLVTAFVLFFPGYALVSAVFPERHRLPTESSDSNGWNDRQAVTERGISNFERVVYSVAFSAVVVPFFGLLLDVTPFKIRLLPLVLVATAFTVAAAGVAAWRRTSLPPGERYRPPAVPNSVGATGLDASTASTAFVVLSALLLVGSASYVAIDPGREYTEFYLLTDQGGQMTADSYPDKLTVGQQSSLIVGINNHGGKTTNYTVVTQLQRVDEADNETRVTEQRRLSRFRVAAQPNETVRRTHEFTPNMEGQRLRLVYLLYRGPIPDEPSAENAYRYVHLWIDVAEPSSSATASETTTPTSTERPTDRSPLVTVPSRQSDTVMPK